jgi:hypothetical protein
VGGGSQLGDGGCSVVVGSGQVRYGTEELEVGLGLVCRWLG